MKACKQGDVIEVTQCRLAVGNQFMCRDVVGRSFPMMIDEMENYFCATSQDRKRIIQRCQKQAFLSDTL